MDGDTHLIWNILAVITVSLFLFELRITSHETLAMLLGSLLTVRFWWYPIRPLDDREKGGRREFWHSLLWPAILLAIWYYVIEIYGPSLLAFFILGICIGWVIHVLLDSLTDEGTMILYPLSVNLALRLGKNRNLSEPLFWIAYVILAAELIWFVGKIIIVKR